MPTLNLPCFQWSHGQLVCFLVTVGFELQIVWHMMEIITRALTSSFNDNLSFFVGQGIFFEEVDSSPHVDYANLFLHMI